MNDCNSPSLNPISDRAKWAKVKRGWTVLLYSIHCVSISVSGHNRPWFLLLILLVIVLGGISPCIQLFLLKSVENGDEGINTLSDSYKHSYDKTNDLTKRRLSYCIGTRSIVRPSGLSCNHIALSYNTRFHCTIVAYRRKKMTMMKNGFVKNVHTLWSYFQTACSP